MTPLSGCPTVSNDMLAPSAPLMATNGDPERAATVIKYNGEILLRDRDTLERWQNWYKTKAP